MTDFPKTPTRSQTILSVLPARGWTAPAPFGPPVAALGLWSAGPAPTAHPWGLA